jgi:aspartate-semialdehyde dehydrogenase
MSGAGLRVAIAGATGAVGREMVATLELRGFEVSELRPLASARSVGQLVHAFGRDWPVRELTADAFEGIDIALFSAGGDRSRDFAPAAVAAGAVVIDNSSFYRLDAEVPLVVPEVNAEAIHGHRGIIANPNCSTIQMVLPLEALRRAVGIERVVVSTYQSAAGAGQAGIDELLAVTASALAGEPLVNKTFARPLAFDALPHIGTFQPSGYSSEEEKMCHETRKIMGLAMLPVSATCVRVPVLRGHLESVTVDLCEPLPTEQARAVIAAFPGIVVEDEPASNRYPTARDCVGRLETFVGRIRQDNTLPRTLHFWVVSDNLLKGAAWNAVQIAEYLTQTGRHHAS